MALMPLVVQLSPPRARVAQVSTPLPSPVAAPPAPTSAAAVAAVPQLSAPSHPGRSLVQAGAGAGVRATPSPVIPLGLSPSRARPQQPLVAQAPLPVGTATVGTGLVGPSQTISTGGLTQHRASARAPATQPAVQQPQAHSQPPTPTPHLQPQPQLQQPPEVPKKLQKPVPQQVDGGSKAKVPPLQSISLTKPPPELPVQILVEFEGEADPLGEGAFAVVRRLRHRKTGEAVALKVVEKYPLHIRNMLPQLQREVRIQGSLQHRHILRLLSCLEDDAYVYMLLEHCAGGSLRILCAKQPAYRLPEARAARYFAQILKGVDFMHHHLCVHRDLKPENMLLTAEDEVRICDFGWSAEVQVEQALRTTCGTPHYWPPEIFEHESQDVGVDLWALGTLVYELLVGHAPFWGNMEELRRKVLSCDVRYPPGLLSHEAINLFYCLLQRDPRKRVSAGRLLAEHPWVHTGLMALTSLRSSPGSTPPVPAGPQTPRSSGAEAEPPVAARELTAVPAPNSQSGGSVALPSGSLAPRCTVDRAASSGGGPQADTTFAAAPVQVAVSAAPTSPSATTVVAPVIRPAPGPRRPATALSAALPAQPPQALQPAPSAVEAPRLIVPPAAAEPPAVSVEPLAAVAANTLTVPVATYDIPVLAVPRVPTTLTASSSAAELPQVPPGAELAQEPAEAFVLPLEPNTARSEPEADDERFDAAT